MATNRRAWAPDEREEYDDLLAEVVGATNNTTARLDLFECKLNDAIQAHRPWASDVRRWAVRDGLAKEIKAFQDRNRAMVAYDGQVLNLPRVQGTVARTDEGQAYHQRELIELWTWDQIAEKRVDAIKAQQHYTEKIAHYDRLLALRVMCPDSATPVDAAARLGIDLDDFLAGVA